MCYVSKTLAVKNTGKFGELIFDSPNFSLSMFYKPVNLILYTYMIQVAKCFVHSNMAAGSILKYFRPVGSSTLATLLDQDGPLSERFQLIIKLLSYQDD